MSRSIFQQPHKANKKDASASLLVVRVPPTVKSKQRQTFWPLLCLQLSMMGFKAFSSINSMLEPNFIWENIQILKKIKVRQITNKDSLPLEEEWDGRLLFACQWVKDGTHWLKPHSARRNQKSKSNPITCVDKTVKIGTSDRSGVSVKHPSEAWAKFVTVKHCRQLRG